MGRAFTLIWSGLFKKVVLSSYLAAAIVDPVFGNPKGHTSLEILFAVYAYAVQIYADFSGYTDIAIGVALLLGFHFPENFNAPYTARSIQDFWRRWHITLSRWLRDYLYVPLGGSRGSELHTDVSIMVTMLLGGLWHGAAWTFVAWGGIHGLGQVVGHRRRQWRLSRGLPPLEEGAWAVFRQRVITFHVVCLGWVFFRADSFGTASQLLWRLFTAFGSAPAVHLLVVAAIAVGIFVQYIPRDAFERLGVSVSHLRPVALGLALAAGLLLITTLGPQGVAPFIYYRF